MAKGSGFGSLVKLAILAAALYFGYTQGWPWLQDQLGSGGGSAGAGGGDDGGTRCVELAFRANDSLASEIGRFTRSVDLDAWESVASRVRGRISDAESGCGCNRDSCRQAQQALGELTGLLEDWDRGFRGGSPPLNPAQQQERIYQLLNEARSLARQAQ